MTKEKYTFVVESDNFELLKELLKRLEAENIGKLTYLAVGDKAKRG